MARVTCFVALLLLPSVAGADVLLSPFVGGNSSSSGMEKSLNVGLAAGWISSRGVGVEGELAQLSSPFEDGRLDDGSRLDRGSNYVRTLMGNVIATGRGGLVAPYVAGGLGLLTIRYGDFESPRHNLALNAGGGLRAGRGRVTLRGDLRYFRTLTEQRNVFANPDPPAFSYWRAAVGLTARF